MKHRYKILIAILVAAVFFRFFLLWSVPPSPSLDEVSIGYNAYSILKTGMDEYGTKFPLILRAYDDYRPALYVYLVIPWVWILGLSTIAVRMPSVILSVITVYLTYLITGLLARKNQQIPLVAAFLLAISPWHVYISRLGHEANLGLALTVGAIYLFLAGVYKRRKGLLAASLVCFGISLYGYQSQKVVMPMLIAGFGILYVPYLKKRIKEVIIGFVCLLVLGGSVLYISRNPESLIRIYKTSEFSLDNALYMSYINRYERAKREGDVIGQLINHRRVIQFTMVGENVMRHMNPIWLLGGTSREQHKAPYVGLLYPWEGILLILGVLYCIRAKRWRLLALMGLWIFSAVVPASIASGAPHAMRFYTSLPAWQILSAFGLTYALGAIKILRIRRIATGLTIVVVIASGIYFARQYFVVFPRMHSGSFQYALSNALLDVIRTGSAYDHIVVTNEDNGYQSYMFYLFHTRFDPATYISMGGTKSGGFDKTHEIGSYEFRPVYRDEKFQPGWLYIANADDLPPHVPVQKTYKNLDGQVTLTAHKL